MPDPETLPSPPPDRLENIGCYRTLSSNFEAAVAFLEKTDLDLLPVGQFEVKGKDVYGFVVDRTLEEEPRQWEIHNFRARDLPPAGPLGRCTSCGKKIINSFLPSVKSLPVISSENATSLSSS